MRHGIDDIIDADLCSKDRVFGWVAGRVEELPRVSKVGVEREGHHDAAFVVVDSLPVSDVAILFVACVQVFGAGDLEAIIEIENGMEDCVVVWNVDEVAFWEDHLHGLFEVGLFLGAVAVVGHEEASTEKVVAELSGLGLGESPLADLHGLDPGPVVEFIAVVDVDGLLDRAGVDAAYAAAGVGHGAVSAWGGL